MPDKKSTESNKMDTAALWRVVIIRFMITTVMMLGVLFLSAGRFDWWEGWVYGVSTAAFIIIGRSLLLLKDPDIIRERMEAGAKDDAKPWDKKIVPFIAVYGPMIVWVVAGLDKRFGWSPDTSNTIQIAAFVIYLVGSLFATWATFANRFFSSHVRIQTDRGHEVADQGPYSVVRHPGYAGGVLGWIAIPFFFGSYWAAIPCLVIIIGYGIRTSLEDRTLQEELPGYREYAGRVRYRLLPGIW